MRFVALVLVSLSVVLSLGGCCWVGGDYALYSAVTVELVDSVTGGPINAVPTGMLTDGRYREIMRVDRNHVIGGRGRPGRYDVEIAAAGYRTWTRTGIGVPGDFCGGITEPAELTALMVPLVPPPE